MKVNFTSDIELGFTLEMTCSWESSNDEKTIQWYRQSNMDKQYIWTFAGNSTVATENAATDGFQHKFQHIPQTDYETFHKILLSNASQNDEWFYGCEIKISDIPMYDSLPRRLNVIGNRFV